MPVGPLPHAVSADLSRRVAQAQVRWRAPAVAAALVRDGHTVFSTGVGASFVPDGPPPSANTQFRIGSITKTFTAVLVMQLRDEGKLNLDDPLGEHIPETRHGQLTLRRMLCHLSGLQREPVGDVWEAMVGQDRDTLLANLEQAEAVLPQHQRWHYSNLAYALLGEVVARVRGATWADVLAEKVLLPLGLTRTSCDPVEPRAAGYHVDPYADRVRPEPLFPGQAFAPMGELWSTTTDLGRWASFLATGADEVLAASTLEEMAHPQVMHDLDAWRLAWGLGLMLHRRGEKVLIGHDGAMPGFLAGLAIRRQERIGAVVFANTSAAADPGALAIELALELLERDPATPTPWRVGPAVPGELEDLLGEWWSEGSRFTFTVSGGQLRARRADAPAGAPPSVFAPIGPDLYRTLSGREQGELLRVTRDEHGRVRRMYWATYPFTRAPGPFGS
jgi:CubicO group peptidase (beta-lactamase class C family)